MQIVRRVFCGVPQGLLYQLFSRYTLQKMLCNTVKETGYCSTFKVNFLRNDNHHSINLYDMVLAFLQSNHYPEAELDNPKPSNVDHTSTGPVIKSSRIVEQWSGVCEPIAVKRKAPRNLAPTTNVVAMSDSMETSVALNPYDIAEENDYFHPACWILSKNYGPNQ